MGADVIYESPRVRVRRARPDDSPALCELLRKVHLRGELDVTQERDPDFFALLAMHQGELDVWLGEGPEDGKVGGLGTVVVRDGLVDGAPAKVGYLADLRALPGFRGVKEMPRAYHRALEHARDVHGAELFYTVIFDENRLARRALVEQKGKKRREGQPIYRAMTPFQMTSIQFTRRRSATATAGRRISRARPEDLGALTEYLAARAKLRVMGEKVTQEWLERRFALWPGFSIESFFVARDAGGRIVGTLAPWDTSSMKRTRVLGYHGKMKWVSRAFNLGAKVMGFPPLPPPGECFRFAFLSHLEITDDDPAVLHDLLRTVYAELRAQDLHFISAMIPRGSRLEAAFGGFFVNRTPMTVYSVTLPESRWADRDFTTLHPGFEMALS
ncbi:hypothetical protein L6R52_34240 [Myxococcota bacterium]|nr:hypothetical protein [Myxococcota bacterium]